MQWAHKPIDCSLRALKYLGEGVFMGDSDLKTRNSGGFRLLSPGNEEKRVLPGGFHLFAYIRLSC